MVQQGLSWNFLIIGTIWGVNIREMAFVWICCPRWVLIIETWGYKMI